MASGSHTNKGIWADLPVAPMNNNSAANPDNPNPNVWCSWGLKTTDEMFGAAMYYTPTEKLAAPLLIENGRLVRGSAEASSRL